MKTPYLALTDRAFWLQKYQNLIIFDHDLIFYTGFADIAQGITQSFVKYRDDSNRGNITIQVKEKSDRNNLLEQLATLTVNKMNNGIR